LFARFDDNDRQLAAEQRDYTIYDRRQNRVLSTTTSIDIHFKTKLSRRTGQQRQHRLPDFGLKIALVSKVRYAGQNE
jgi:hypothetical protein